MSDKGLEAGLGLISTVMKEIVNESQEIMKIHPVNSLVMLNLFGNLGFALLTEPDEHGLYKFSGPGGIQMYSTRTDMIADVFRLSAMKTGTLLSVEAVSQIFSLKFDLGVLAKAITK